MKENLVSYYKFTFAVCRERDTKSLCHRFVQSVSCGTYEEELFSQFALTVSDKSVTSRALLPTGRSSRGFGTPFPIPAWSFLCRRGQRLQQFFLGGGVGGREGGYLAFILRLGTASSIFTNIFVQDCRLRYGTNCFDHHFHYKNLP